jgi:hypothetical protein
MATAPTELEQLIQDTYGHKTVKMKQSDVDKVKRQILSQGLTDKWKGQGFGSADANALDMAKSLVASGVTDIKQIGQGTFYVPQAVQERLVDANGQPVEKLRSNGQYVIPQYAVNGETGSTEIVGYTDVPADQVKKQYGYDVTYDNGQEYGSGTAFQELTPEQQSKLKTDANGQMSFLVPGGEGIINKDTGERILSNYNERTQGNAFGGTYAGKGNTAYRVQFDPKGNPVFYTTEASSNDLLNILQGNPILNAAANIGAAYFGGPMGTMALQAAQGKDTTDILKAGALSWAGGQAGSYLSGSESLVDVLGKTGANIAANAAKSFITSEGRLDPVAALLSGGMDAGVGAIIGNIPGFEGLDKGTQTLVTKAISNTLRTGKLDPVSLAQAAFKAGTSAMANATNVPTEAQTSLANYDFLKTLEPYLTTSSEFSPETKGDWDEVAGKFIPNEGGGTTYGQIDPQTSGNVNNMKDWSVDSKTGEWSRTDPITGEKTVYDYKTPITGTAQTGAEIMDRAGASANTTTANKTAANKTATDKAANTKATQPNNTATPYNLELLGLAKIDPMEELFGGSIYTSKPAPPEQEKQYDPVAEILAQGDEEYASGGHVDDFNVEALLHILRS